MTASPPLDVPPGKAPLAATTDRLVQLALIAAYRLLRVWGRFRPPTYRVVTIAVWHAGRILIVRHSYRPGYALPGGRARRGETPAAAACRELREEVGIGIAPGDLVAVYARGRSHLFEYHAGREPVVRIDNREIVEAAFMDPAGGAELAFDVRHYLGLRRPLPGRTQSVPVLPV